MNPFAAPTTTAPDGTLTTGPAGEPATRPRPINGSASTNPFGDDDESAGASAEPPADIAGYMLQPNPFGESQPAAELTEAAQALQVADDRAESTDASGGADAGAVAAEGESSDGGARGWEIRVDAPSLMADLARGLADALATARHSDLRFDVRSASVAAHRVVLEARCGERLVRALEGGKHGVASVASGVLVVAMPSVDRGVLHTLLTYVYTEQLELPGDGHVASAAVFELIELCHAFDDGCAVPALSRLTQLCEERLAATVTLGTVVDVAHRADEIGAGQLVAHCVRLMTREFSRLDQPTLAALRTPLCARLFLERSDAPLQEALAAGRVDAVQWLLARADDGAEQRGKGQMRSSEELLAALDSAGRTALEIALSRDDLSSAALLLSSGANPTARAAEASETLLHMAAGGQLRADSGGGGRDPRASAKVELLLKLGASVNASDDHGRSPLDVAIFNGR